MVDENGAARDISNAVKLEMYFVRPDHTKFEVTPVFETDGLDGYIIYDCLTADLNMAGDWYAQGWAELPNSKRYHTDPIHFKVGTSYKPTT